MNVLLITYELADTGAGEGAREALSGALEAYAIRAQLTSSAWLVRTTASVADVLDALDRHLTANDRLFVAAVSGEAAWRNIDAGYDWLDEQLGHGDPRDFSSG